LNKKNRFYELLIKLLIMSLFISYAINLLGIQLQVSDILIYILLMIVFIDIMQRKLSITVDVGMLFVLINLIAIFTLATALSNNKLISVRGEIKWIIGISLTIFLPAIIRTYNLNIQILLKYILKIGTLISFLKMVQILITRDVSLAGIEVFGFGANQWGQIGSILLCINTVYIYEEKNKKIYISYFLLNEIILILTMSMTNWIVGNFMVLIICFKLNKKNKIKNIFAFIVIFILLSIIFRNILNIFFSDRIMQIMEAFKNPLQYKTMNIRYNIWTTAIDLGIKNTFGVGLYNLQFYLPVNHAHNIFIEILGSTGIYGLIIFVIYLSMILTKAYKILKVNDGYYCYKIGMFYSMVSYIVSNNFSDSFGARTHLFFWIITSLLFSVKGSKNSNESKILH
jgi:O-antigen ligase